MKLQIDDAHETVTQCLGISSARAKEIDEIMALVVGKSLKVEKYSKTDAFSDLAGAAENTEELVFLIHDYSSTMEKIHTQFRNSLLGML